MVSTLWDYPTFEDAFKAMNNGKVECEFYGLSWFLMHMHPSLPQEIRERYKINREGPVVDGEIRRVIEAYIRRYDITVYDKYVSKKHNRRCTYAQGVLLDLSFIPLYQAQVQRILEEYIPKQRVLRSRKRQRSETETESCTV